MRKKGCLLQKISRKLGEILLKSCSGQTEAAAGMFLLLFLAVLLYGRLQTETYRAAAQYLEDALAASNLASAVIDVEEYGISHNIIIEDPQLSFEKYKEALKGNLNLDDSWQCPNKRMISGQVTIADYIIYNCEQEQISAYRIGETGILEQWQGRAGEITAPNGVPVESTGIYSEITFPVEGVWGISTEARKGKLVDIVSNE